MADDVDEAKESLVQPDSNSTKSCIDMKLNGFVKDRRIVPLIESAVERTNIMVFEAYEFANFHINRVLSSDGGMDLPVVDRNFYYRCVACVATTNAKASTVSPEMRRSSELFDALRPPGQLRVNASDLMELIPDLTVTMETAALNHLWDNLRSRTGRWLKCHHPELKKHFPLIISLIFNGPTIDFQAVKRLSLDEEKKLDETEKAHRQQARDIIARFRRLCPLKRGLKAKGTKAKCRSHTLLPLYWELFKDFERIFEARRQSIAQGEDIVPRRTAARRFDLLPRKKSFTPMFIPIQSRFLLSMLQTIRNPNGSMAQVVQYQWSRDAD